MKTYSAPLIAVLVSLSAFLSCLALAGAERADWKVLREDVYANRFSYDAASVKQTAGNTITVWTKSDGAKYLYEIDCKNRKVRLLEGTGSTGLEWFAIVSGSGDELLSKAVCP